MEYEKIENESITKKKKLNKKGIITAIVTAINSFTFSSCYAITPLGIYIFSNIYHKTKNPKVTVETSYLIYPIFANIRGLNIFLVDFIKAKIGIRACIFIGTLLMTLSSFLILNSMNMYLVLISVGICGVGASLNNSLQNQELSEYFPDNLGLISAIVNIAENLGQSFFTVIGEKIVGAKDEDKIDGYIKREVAERIKYFLYLQMICVTTGGILCTLFVFPSNREKEKIKEKIEKIPINTNLDIENFETKDEIIPIKDIEENKFPWKELKQILKTFKFWRYALILFFLSPFVNLTFEMYNAIGLKVKIDKKYTDFIGLSFWISVTIFTVIFGILFDYINFRIIINITSLIPVIVSFTYYYTLKKSGLLFTINTLSNSIAVAGVNTTLIPHIIKVYSNKILLPILSIIETGINLTGLITSYIAFLFEGLGNNIDQIFNFYFYLFNFLGIFCLIAWIFSFFEDNNPFVYE